MELSGTGIDKMELTPCLVDPISHGNKTSTENITNLNTVYIPGSNIKLITTVFKDCL